MKKRKVKSVLLSILIASMFVAKSPVCLSVKKLEEKEMSKWEVYTWEDKLKRGSINFVTAPREIPYSVRRVSEKRGKGAGWSWGLLEGSGRMVRRWWYGMIELFTFPFNFPDEDKAPMIEPEFVWQRKIENARAS